MTRRILLLVPLVLLVAACGDDDSSGGTPEAADVVIDPGDGGNYAPTIDPADFVAGIDNPYLPFRPGAHWTYVGSADGEAETTEVVVTDDRKEVMGIQATVVRDTVSVDGEVKEDTYDWYAQDREGNVWYLGEDTKEYEDGQVSSTEGSWEAGVDGALPGIVMQAHPEVGEAYRQEYYPGQAEDLAEVLKLGESRSVAMGDYDDVVVIREWNPLEPEVVEEKSFAPGVGLIAEKATRGTQDQSELTAYESGGA